MLDKSGVYKVKDRGWGGCRCLYGQESVRCIANKRPLLTRLEVAGEGYPEVSYRMGDREEVQLFAYTQDNEGWGDYRWLVGLIPTWTPCSRHNTSRLTEPSILLVSLQAVLQFGQPLDSWYHAWENYRKHRGGLAFSRYDKTRKERNWQEFPIWFGEPIFWLIPATLTNVVISIFNSWPIWIALTPRLKCMYYICDLVAHTWPCLNNLCSVWRIKSCR